MIRLIEALVTGWWKRSPWGLVLTLVGVALGSGVALAVHLASRSVHEAFMAGIETLAGPPGHIIRAPAGDLDERLLLRLQRDTAATTPLVPLVEGELRTLGAEAQDLTLTGIDLACPMDAWGEIKGLGDPDDLFAPAAVLWPDDRRQDKFRPVMAGSRHLRLRVVGRLLPRGRGPVQPRVLCDIAEAQRLLERPGRLDRILVLGELPKGLAERVRQVGLVLEPAGSRAVVLDQMARAFRFNLSALSLVSVLLGTALTLNLLGRSFGARRSTMARIHALGGSRRVIATLLLAEGAAIGCVGGFLGVGVGVFLASSTTQAIRRTVSALYGRTGPAWSQLETQDVVLAIASATICGCLAAAVPAWRALSIAPSLTGQEHPPERQPPPWPHGWTFTGFVLLLAALGTSAVATVSGTDRTWTNLLALASATLLAAGTAALAPLALRLMAPIRTSRRYPWMLVPALAARSLALGWRRHALAVAAIILASGMVLGMGTMVASFRGSVAQWAQRTLSADLFLSSRQGEGTREGGTLSPALAGHIARLPGIRSVEATYEVRTQWRQRPVTLAGMPIHARAGRGEMPLLQGRLPRRPDEVLVTEALWRHHRLETGMHLDLPAATGSLGVTVTGVVQDYASDQGQIFMTHEVFFRAYPGWLRPRSLAITLATGADAGNARRAMLRALPEADALVCRTPGELRGEVLRIFDETFALTRAIEAIGLLVALLGLASSQASALAEERSLLVQFRWLGFSAGDLVRYALGQAWLATMTGTLLGTLLGLGLARLLVDVLNPAAFGWHLPFTLQPLRMALILLVLPAAGILASVGPARAIRQATDPGVVRP
ncbi:MAG: ABC transporter permease [Candidatus Sericytochromatia bacterium]|nr:ABC transporter permease [Candidatus Sericytochromatia bacterium]